MLSQNMILTSITNGMLMAGPDLQEQVDDAAHKLGLILTALTHTLPAPKKKKVPVRVIPPAAESLEEIMRQAYERRKELRI